jgi:hypothetical protein
MTERQTYGWRWLRRLRNGEMDFRIRKLSAAPYRLIGQRSAIRSCDVRLSAFYSATVHGFICVVMRIVAVAWRQQQAVGKIRRINIAV